MLLVCTDAARNTFATRFSFGEGVSGPVDFTCGFMVILPGPGIFRGSAQSSGVITKTKQTVVSENLYFLGRFHVRTLSRSLHCSGSG